MHKKGIFFTFIAVTIMMVFILVFTPQSDLDLQKDNNAVRGRIESVNNYVSDLESSYLEAVLRSTTYKTLLSLAYYINSTGAGIPDFNESFAEVILTGNISGIPIDSITGKSIMSNNTIPDWNNRIIQTASDTLNVQTSINVINVSVFQTKPWSVDSRLYVNFTVTSNVAEWSKSAIVDTSIDIEGLYDPYYMLKTNGLLSGKVKKSSVPLNSWNIAKVREHLRNGTYIYWESQDAPSFLSRFTSQLDNSTCCGIESLVRPNMASPQDQTESYVDYLFWTHRFNSQCTQLYNITGLWNEFRFFKLDLDHVVRYNITSADAVRTC